MKQTNPLSHKSTKWSAGFAKRKQFTIGIILDPGDPGPERLFWGSFFSHEVGVIVCSSRIPPTTWLIRAKVDSFVSFTRVEHSRKVSRLVGQLTESLHRK